MSNKIIKTIPKSGFTLIEVMVSVVLFTMIILSVTGIFKMAIDAQRNAIAAQNVQESLKYFFEITGKEMRMAIKNNGACDPADVPLGSIFGVRGFSSFNEILIFENYHGECVTYSLVEDGDVLRFAISRKNNLGTKVDFISPVKILLSTLHFTVKGGPALPKQQPLVTMSLKASSVGTSQFASEMIMQTSISSRYYRKN